MHTKGPWFYTKEKIDLESWHHAIVDREIEHPQDDFTRILNYCSVICAFAEEWEPSPKNIDLIAAAPDLLEACETAYIRLMSFDEFSKDKDNPARKLIETAITKAKGG